MATHHHRWRGRRAGVEPTPGIMTVTPPPAAGRLRLDDDNDLVTAVPYLVGFHPEDSLVCVCLRGDRLGPVLHITSRLDAPARAVAAGADACRAAEVTAVYLIGYGRADHVDAVSVPLAARLAAEHVIVLRMLRVQDGRGHVLGGNGHQCGLFAVEPGRSTVAGHPLLRGRVVYASLAEVEATAAAVTGDARDAMHTAARAARVRLDELRRGTALAGAPDRGRQRFEVLRLAEGIRAVGRARAVTGRLSTAAVAWLVLMLTDRDVHFDAAAGCDGSPGEIELWADVTRRAAPRLVAGPAALLALNAYLGSQDALAVVALARALAADPGNELARIVAEAQRRGVDRAGLRAAFTRTQPLR
ncbi:DUF4192 family protein [Dactylosporangium sp. NPDC051541]|uniref:DUF4192 family protein n=1 Tax=Dactylosporangium sp. NPDC051541 TaxID=3363977 RepID=UPI003794303D